MGPVGRAPSYAEGAGVQSCAWEGLGGHRAGRTAEQVGRLAPKSLAEAGLGVGAVRAHFLSAEKRGHLGPHHGAPYRGGRPPAGVSQITAFQGPFSCPLHM